MSSFVNLKLTESGFECSLIYYSRVKRSIWVKTDESDSDGKTVTESKTFRRHTDVSLSLRVTEIPHERTQHP